MGGTQAILKPRKSPVQARSALTVEALHAATIQVLIAEGLSRCTTTRIAERAGTSVGSLYQYYPNRDALLASVLEKHLAGVADAVESTCREYRGQPVSQMASAFVSAFVRAKLRDVDEAKALYAVAEERGGVILATRMRERIVGAVAAMLKSAPDACFDDPASVATIALGALLGPMQSLLKVHAPAAYEKHLERELVTLLTAYLRARQLNGECAGGGVSCQSSIIP